jgi:hypothetical protein
MIFHAKYLQLVNCFELEDPGAMFNLIAVVKLRVLGSVVRPMVRPHFIDDFEPTMCQAT